MKFVGPTPFVIAMSLGSAPALAANVVVQNADDPGIGLNAPQAVSPVGGNPGTTLGAQRLNVMVAAAQYWGALLQSEVDIDFQLSFAPLECETVAVLGSAGAAGLFRNFEGAPEPDTWYHSALAESLAGRDLSGASPDVIAQFNALVDTDDCLPGVSFYYGLDHAPRSDQVDLLAVALHEIAHGLGFSNFVNETTGEYIAAYPSAFSRFTLDLDTGLLWSEMSAAERQRSANRTRGVVWTGNEVFVQSPSVLASGAPDLVLTPAVNGFTGVVDEAEFGPRVADAPVEGVLVSANPLDACSPLSAIEGQVALVDRGGCSFLTKAQNVETAGGVALLVKNLDGGSPPGVMTGTGAVSIPALRLTAFDGVVLEQAMNDGPVNARLASTGRYYGLDDNGFALLYTPDPVRTGSTMSHFDTSAKRRIPDAGGPENLLMEPSMTRGLSDVDLTLPLLLDMGWKQEPTCGNGQLDEGEACDDGAREDGDGCSATCRVEVCGDGHLGLNEECDDGSDNGAKPGTCRSDCLLPRCGDGIVNGTEGCDAGANNDDALPDHCRLDCKRPRCGDGVIDSSEACDDGPNNDDSTADACRTTCRAPRCGDGIIDSGEACDDGNAFANDGCDASCRASKNVATSNPETSGAQIPGDSTPQADASSQNAEPDPLSAPDGNTQEPLEDTAKPEESSSAPVLAATEPTGDDGSTSEGTSNDESGSLPARGTSTNGTTLSQSSVDPRGGEVGKLANTTKSRGDAPDGAFSAPGDVRMRALIANSKGDTTGCSVHGRRSVDPRSLWPWLLAIGAAVVVRNARRWKPSHS